MRSVSASFPSAARIRSRQALPLENQYLGWQLLNGITKEGRTNLAKKAPHVSDLMRGRARAFSAERLMEFLTALGHDVEIRVRRTRKEHGHMSVIVAG